MSQHFVVIRADGWARYVSGFGSWGLCKQAGGRKPAWSRTAKAWVVSERTARRVVELAEASGLGVVVTRAEGEQPAPAAEPEQAALW
jgi:hypothetical protein